MDCRRFVSLVVQGVRCGGVYGEESTTGKLKSVPHDEPNVRPDFENRIFIHMKLQLVESKMRWRAIFAKQTYQLSDRVQ